MCWMNNCSYIENVLDEMCKHVEIRGPKTKEDPKANVNGKMCKTQNRKGSDVMSTKKTNI
jgi:hypothetical protein